MADYLAHPERYPVLPPVKPGQLTDALPARGPERGEPMDGILDDFERLIVPAATHWNHPGFMAYFANSATAEGILGELLAAALNGNGMLWKTSPAITELEQVTLRWLRQWTGLPEDWFGIIYDTASTSSMHAIAAAREAADPECATKGAARGLVVYTSEQAHSSIEKGAIAVGIGQDNVRNVPVGRRVPHAAGRTRRNDRARPRRRPAPLLRRRHRGHHFHHQRGPGAGHRGPSASATTVAARGRRLRRLGRRGAGIPLGSRRLRARRFVWSPIRTSGCSPPSDCSVFYTAVRRCCGGLFRWCPNTCARRRSARRQPDGLRRAAAAGVSAR